jgi:uncharacterized membrane protein YraQ (UPF0718 family)
VIRAKVSEAISRVRPEAQEQLEAEGFRSEMREKVKRVSRNSVREVRDNGEAVLSIGSFIRGCINRWGDERKSRDRVRM